MLNVERRVPLKYKYKYNPRLRSPRNLLNLPYSNNQHTTPPDPQTPKEKKKEEEKEKTAIEWVRGFDLPCIRGPAIKLGGGEGISPFFPPRNPPTVSQVNFTRRCMAMEMVPEPYFSVVDHRTQARGSNLRIAWHGNPRKAGWAGKGFLSSGLFFFSSSVGWI
ncbi:uncharacterized protein BO72DRAFT_284396 [Aspergillus fijiensis CBS 313.89]|uniref:Uncharacterized protein n=1 Tax=Aspergillus fijiensis CBS 313.89 TaxID=1448319 RepID=A0A8G1W2E9_9EURO|nr:uncharacterized protein BO72DRAFT_284396 [Aspergillus fijiensis CBS 313.89]RAK80598.1 hypothetical protein BO72DRAFT_284396 [Aspergillus fijiensis CBS 313.89]